MLPVGTRERRRIARLLPSDAWLGNSYNTTSLQEGFRYHAALGDLRFIASGRIADSQILRFALINDSY